MNHTPTPWRVGDIGHTVFGPPNGNPSPETIGSIRTQANAAYIVQAVNCHQELLGIVKELLSELSWTAQKNPQYGIEGTIEKAEKLIAKAERK